MIYLIARAPRFSPNSLERDAAILAAIAQRIDQLGHERRIIGEDDLPNALPHARLVISMARDEQALRRLAALETGGAPLHVPTSAPHAPTSQAASVFSQPDDRRWEKTKSGSELSAPTSPPPAHPASPAPRGTLILNSPSRLLRATRSHLARLAQEAGVGVPTLSDTADRRRLEREVGYPLWLKRSDACAQEAGDVCFVEHPAQLEEALARFRRQGYAAHIAARHTDGDLVKFYGVQGTPFFHHLYPTAGEGFSKFGLEARNPRPRHTPFSPEALKACADAIALRAGMPIYGGDAIVRPDGSLALIDFNDFPSFAPCAESAAEAIVSRALRQPPLPLP